MMMGFGAFGGGGPPSSSSSSSSNLSALAPPFTVDRCNLRPPTPNPLVQFSDSQPPYAAPAAPPFNHTTSQYSNPSAPTPRPDVLYHNSELEIDSTRITSVPLANDYRFGYSVSQSSNDPQQSIPWSTVNPTPKISSATFLYDGKLEPYFHPPYVSTLVNSDSPLVALTEPHYGVFPSSGLVSSSNIPFPVDHTQSLSGLDYQPKWHSGWNELVDAKRGKRAELDDIFSLDSINAGDSHAYQNQMNQGYHTFECGNILEKDSGISYLQFSDAIGQESSNDLVRMEPMDNISNLGHRVLSIPCDSSVTTMSSSSFTVPASHPPGSSLHLPKDIMNLQNPYGNCMLAHDASVSGSLSVTKPSPALVIRPPPSALVPQKAASVIAVDKIGSVAAGHVNEGVFNNSPFKGKEHNVLLNSEVEEGSLFSSQHRYEKEGNGQLLSVPSTVMDKLSSNLQTGGGLNNIFKAKSGPQVPNINVSDGFSLSGDCAQATKSSDNVPDSSDHHNFAVDSPCWKGAPASPFSPSDVEEKETTCPFAKKIDKFCQLGPEVDQNFCVPKDPIRCLSKNAGEDKEHECGHAGRGILHNPGNTSGADIAGELKPVDAVKARFKGSILTTSQGVQFCEVYSKTKSDYDFPKPSKNDSKSQSFGTNQLEVEEDNHTTKELNIQTSVMDSVLNTSDSAEGSVAVHAAENVLCSPCEEGTPEQAMSVPKMDAQALVKALQCLSELLLFNCSTDSSALKDEDFEALQCVINNLGVLASKNMGYLTQPQERKVMHQVTCNKVGNFVDTHMSSAAGGCHFENDVGTKSHRDLDYQNTHEEMRNHTVTQEKTKKFQPFSPLTDDLDVSRDDNMAQAIRKVLEENFHSGEEMDSQALLFKNLWLEAEAKLCSISYKARFDRMKIEMQKFKSNQAKEKAAASENTSISSGSQNLRIFDSPPPKVGNGALQKTTIRSLPSLSPTSNVNDVEDSVMTRYHILKCRDNSKNSNLVREEADTVDGVSLDKMPFFKDHAIDGRLNVAVGPDSQEKCDVDQGHVGLHLGGSQNEPISEGLSSVSNIGNVEASIMSRFNILKCRHGLNGTNSVGQQADFVDAVYPDIMPISKDQPKDGGRLNFAVEPHSYKTGDIDQCFVGLHVGGSGYESEKDFFLSVPDDPVNQSCATYGQRSQYSLGFSDNCSADWEHVLKDDATWH